MTESVLTDIYSPLGMKNKALFLLDSRLLDVRLSRSKLMMWRVYGDFETLLYSFQHIGIISEQEAQDWLDKASLVTKETLATL